MTDDRLRMELIGHIAQCHESARRLILTVEKRRRDGPPETAGADAAGWQRAIDALCQSDVWREHVANVAGFQAWAESVTTAATAQTPPRGGPTAGAPNHGGS